MKLGSAPATVHYAWECLETGSQDWTPLTDDEVYSGTRTNRLTVKTADSMSGNQYRCRLYNREAQTYTDAAVMTVGTLANYTVNFGGLLENGEFSDSVGTVTARSGDKSLTSGSTARELDALEVTASVQEGSVITGWTRNGSPIPAQEIETIEDGTQRFRIDSMSQNEEIQVHYLKYPVITWEAPKDTTLSVTGTPVGGEEGALTSGDRIAYGSTVTVQAQPPENHVVSRWTVNGVSTAADSNQLVLEDVRQDTEIQAAVEESSHFSAAFSGLLDGQPVTEAVGSVTAMTDGAATSGKVYEGHSVTFTARAEAGYLITGWTLDGEPVEAILQPDGSQTYVIPAMYKNAELVVTFAALPASTTVAVGQNGSLSTVMAGGLDMTDGAENGMNFRPGVPVTVTVQPDVGYEVAAWTVNGYEVAHASGNTYTYQADRFGAAIEVEFRPVAYAVSWEQAEAADAVSGQQFRGGSQLTLTAEEVPGYRFAGWSLNGEPLEDAAEKTLNWTVPLGVPEGTAYLIRPIYTAEVYTVTVEQPANGRITADGMTENRLTVGPDEEVTLRAIPANPGYFVSGWKIDGEEVTVSTPDAALSGDGTELTLHHLLADHTVTAVFDSAAEFTVRWTLQDSTPEKLPGVEITAEDLIVTAGGEPLANGEQALSGQAVRFELPAISEYQAIAWTVNGETAQGDELRFVFETPLLKDLNIEITVVDAAALYYDVSTGETEHGTLTAAPAAQRKNQTVTVTAEPDLHYHLKELTVQAGEASAAVTEQEDGSFTFVMPEADAEVRAVFEEDPKAVVTFVIENGTWADGTTEDRTVSVYFEPGTQAGTLRAEDVPADMQPISDRYHNGGWDKEPLTAENGVTEDVTYTYSYARKSSGGGGGGGGSAPITPEKPQEPAVPEIPEKPTFEDVAPDAYYRDAVEWAVEQEITKGLTENRFAPDGSCTRAHAVTFLWRAAGEPEPAAADSPFTDLSQDAYYDKAVLWATEQGITKGTTETTFSPDAACTRAQIVTFLYRAQ